MKRAAFNKKSLLWFGQSGSKASFARITESVIKHLNFDITVLSGCPVQGYKFIKVGSPTSIMTFEDYNKASTNGDTQLERMQKYIVIQIADILYSNSFHYLLICNGFTECISLYNSIALIPRKIMKKTKLVFWTPIDYIPIYSQLKDITNCDLFITMTPVMAAIIKDTLRDFKDNIVSVGHGHDNFSEVDKLSRQEVYDILKNLTFYSGKLSLDDVVILNANNIKNTDRKRLDITIDAFAKVITSAKRSNNSKYDNVKLWLHTYLPNLPIIPECIKDRVILSQIGISDYELGLIYKFCQIGLQTSTGEGWSLTNCEHSLLGALQIVPDFLATKYHFGNSSFVEDEEQTQRGFIKDEEQPQRGFIKDEEQPQRGLLIPIKVCINSEGLKIGVVSVEDTSIYIIKAINIIKNNTYFDLVNKANITLKQYTWKSVAEQLETYLNNINMLKDRNLV